MGQAFIFSGGRERGEGERERERGRERGRGRGRERAKVGMKLKKMSGFRTQGKEERESFTDD